MSKDVTPKRLLVAPFVHSSIPQTLTPENLAEWIQKNSKDKHLHEDQIPLTEDQIKAHEHNISNAAREMANLDSLKAAFGKLISKGNGKTVSTVEVPPTLGTDVLKANISFHNTILSQGYEIESTWVFMIPNPEESMMVGVTIEGKEALKYTRKMTEDEKRNYGHMFAKDDNAPEAKRRKKQITEPVIEAGEEFQEESDDSSFV